MSYNVDNKPLNSKKNMRGAVSFFQKNEPRFKSADFFLHDASVILKYIYHSNQPLFGKSYTFKRKIT